MTNTVFFLFWRFSSQRIQELASRSPSQTLEDGKKNYTCSTTHRALPTFRRSPPQQLKKNCGKNVISAVRFFSRLSSSNFLNLLRLQPGLFFYFRLRSFLLLSIPIHSLVLYADRQQKSQRETEIRRCLRYSEIQEPRWHANKHLLIEVEVFNGGYIASRETGR